MLMLSRRLFTAAAAAAALPFPAGASAGEPFSFDSLTERARRSAGTPYREPDVIQNDVLDLIDYDRYQQIRFKPERAVHMRYPVQAFFQGRLFKLPCRLNAVRGGRSLPVPFDPSMFSLPDDHPGRRLNAAGFAGFRVMNDDTQQRDRLAFLGASYFRCAGPDDQYGLSARGIAIDTGLPTPEEFPRFNEFWFVDGERPHTLNIYALLEGASLSGAYRMTFAFENQIVTDIECRLYPRRRIDALGLAPLSSMYWFSEADRRSGVDWRPEIHDSDGLSMHTGAGERIWRPLVNPRRITTSTFSDPRTPRGFGLIQRDRNFDNYQDDGVFYEKRPSVYIEPLNDWGAGAVHLLEIPTDDEIHDNIAVYYRPQTPLEPGRAYTYRYRITWGRTDPLPELGHVISTRIGRGGVPGQPRPAGVHKIAVDFAFPGVAPARGSFAPAVSAARGSVSNVYAVPIEGHPGRARALFDLSDLPDDAEATELRMYLRGNDGRALSETWLYPFIARPL